MTHHNDAGMPRAEFTGRWGFTTPSGIAKPIHRAFQLLHAAGNVRIATAEAAGGSCTSTTVLAVANSTTHGSGAMIFVANGGKASCNVTLTGLPLVAGAANAAYLLHRIDKTHSNPMGVWEGFGSPPFPSLQQIAQLKAATEIKGSPVEIKSGASFKLDVPANGLAVLVL